MSRRRPFCVVEACDRPVNGRLCGEHLAGLTRNLRAVRWLVGELELTATRQARSSASGAPAGESPGGLPLAWNSSDLAYVLTTTLQAWVVDLAGHPLDPTIRGVGQAPELAAYLIASRNRIRTHPAAQQLHDEITWVVGQTRTAIFGPGPLVALGPCDRCNHALHAHRQQAVVQCPRCTLEYDVAARRRLLLDCAKDQLLTASELSRTLPELLGEQLRELTVNRIYLWASRGRLIQQPPGKRYRVRDVLALLDVDLDVA